MKHRFITLMLLLLGATLAAEANPVDMRTAREVGMKFMNANTKTPLRNADELQWVTTYNTNRGDAAFYVFNTQDGFIIVSADDCATPILGYSSEGHFDTENIPIQLQEYLQGFVEQIGYGIENHLQADKRTAEQWERVKTTGYLTNNRANKVVEPLLSTKWSQGCLYNALCPEDEAGQCGHVWTGCVATAMAQIMNYWQWPERGTGEHSYEWNGQTLSANFGATIYDWDNMPGWLTDASTMEQINAVATLMYHCGVAVEMGYGVNSSGAVLGNECNIMREYFNYSEEMSYEGIPVYNGYHSVASFKTKLKDCLNNNRPLYYLGGGSGIHAFVCDGYDVNDMFHFNWGWGGLDDGYYAIGALNPAGPNFNYDFNYGNAAIFNIHPQGETTNYVINVSASQGGVVSGSGTYAHGDTIILTAVPDEGYGFLYWEEEGEPFLTDPIHSFTANYNRNLRGVFAPLEECVFFDDLYVRAICAANWDTNEDGILSYTEAAAVTSLGEVFRGNKWITSFEELEYFTGLTSICDSAFYNCSSLVSAIIPNTVTSIGNYAFYGCEGYSINGNLIIPNSVTTIGNSAFEGSRFWGLGRDLVIPNSVTSIGNRAFADCALWEGSLTIGNSVTEIGSQAFLNSYINGLSINMPNIPGLFAHFVGADFSGPLTIGNSVISIGSYAFKGCEGFTGDLIIPNSVTTIGEGAFKDCHYFNGELIIPNSITVIENSTFDGCYYFTSLTIPNSVTAIGDYAFRNCHWLSGALTIPNSVTRIGKAAFSGCNGFTGDLIIPDSVIFIGRDAFHGCWRFSGCLTIPNSVATISDLAFIGCSFNGLNINMSIIPVSFMEHIGGSFTGSLTIGNAVTSIDSAAFYGCSSFSGKLIIPDSVTTIGHSAFNGCSGLTSLNIGNSVAAINDEAFSGCNKLNKITILAETPPSVGTNTFYDVKPNTTIIVPCGCLQVYKASAWSDYFTSIMQNCIGITEDSENVASVYPNPTDGQVKIEAEGIEHITISNELGQVIYEGKARGNTFEYDFSRHEAGAYLIKIETENGITTKRVFVTR